jgi:flagellar basal-body rod protein FlgC
MSFLDALQTSATGLSAQRLRMNLISSNLANINSTRTEEGGPYKRKDAVFEADPQQPSFSQALSDRIGPEQVNVKVTEIREDNRQPILKYDPDHPDADANGYVALPNINVVEEMVNMLSASRSYEANITALRATKDMATEAMDIGK